uniref:Cytochrome P450 n=1 Tax=Acrobeloides nanus TaxID=290746 RepID=A0A914CYU8_9BILA
MFLQLFLILLGLYLIYNFYWKRRNLPPGPIPFPILGNVIEMFRKPVYQAGIDWHNKYGPIYTAWIGEIPMVVITDYNLINETLVKDADSYAGRPQLSHQLTQSYGKYS